jgi:hypothetical protein
MDPSSKLHNPHFPDHINEKAWQLYNNLAELNSLLWETFENYFLDKCIDMSDDEYHETFCRKQA